MEMCHLNAVSTLRWKPATHSFISADGEPLATFLLMEQNYPRLSVGGRLTAFALSSIWYHEVTYKKITAFNLSKYRDIRTYILLCWIMKSHIVNSPMTSPNITTTLKRDMLFFVIIYIYTYIWIPMTSPNITTTFKRDMLFFVIYMYIYMDPVQWQYESVWYSCNR